MHCDATLAGWYSDYEMSCWRRANTTAAHPAWLERDMTNLQGGYSYPRGIALRASSCLSITMPSLKPVLRTNEPYWKQIVALEWARVAPQKSQYAKDLSARSQRLDSVSKHVFGLEPVWTSQSIIPNDYASGD